MARMKKKDLIAAILAIEPATEGLEAMKYQDLLEHHRLLTEGAITTAPQAQTSGAGPGLFHMIKLRAPEGTCDVFVGGEHYDIGPDREVIAPPPVADLLMRDQGFGLFTEE